MGRIYPRSAVSWMKMDLGVARIVSGMDWATEVETTEHEYTAHLQSIIRALFEKPIRELAVKYQLPEEVEQILIDFL